MTDDPLLLKWSTIYIGYPFRHQVLRRPHALQLARRRTEEAAKQYHLELAEERENRRKNNESLFWSVLRGLLCSGEMLRGQRAMSRIVCRIFSDQMKPGISSWAMSPIRRRFGWEANLDHFWKEV